MAESYPKGLKTVGKGEIDRYEQFLLFLLCFQKTCTADRENQGLFGKRLWKLHQGLSGSCTNGLTLKRTLFQTVCLGV